MNKLAEHLFVSSTDGHLYDTRKPEWHKHAPLRKNYCHTFETINNSHELRATIRNGAYAWPGGYPLVFLTADGDCISFNGAEAQYWQCANDMRNFPRQRIVGCFIHYEGSPIECALSGEQIESAYGDPELEHAE